MSDRQRRPAGLGFGASGGSDVATYVTLSERTQRAEREIEAGERIARVRLDRIDRSRYQVRVHLEGETLEALARDMKEHGLNQPVTVRPKPDGRYELIAGERRWRAAQAAGLETVEARIRDLDDFEAHLVGVSENNQRANLSPWEKALETSRLHEHAASIGRAHSQRDLARYLNRNVAIVNQQLVIARTITLPLMAHSNIAVRDVCALSHETLHGIAQLGPERRALALERAVCAQRERRDLKTTGRAAPGSLQPAANSTGTREGDREEPDRWTQLWENGGFRVNIRKPLREVEPVRARKYIRELLPGIGGLAARAADGDSALPLIEWEHEQGRLFFLRPSRHLAPEGRAAARDLLRRVVADMEVDV